MPHLILEYSANLLEKDKLSDLFAELHQLLVDSLPTQLASCKSRAYEAKDYRVGDGNAQNAFLHLSVRVMAGRSETLLREIAAKIMAVLKSYFLASSQNLNLQISLELGELGKVYLKRDSLISV
ncbi:MAG TPA: 5-carboxymethyl-2-hydroxymuconate Delta-isomerase [Coxiellaceae bacterium]|nr:5-carboxymethyl-2-hydroxymuconate Delta-isomerase [Coxiellaceae bacterium]